MFVGHYGISFAAKSADPSVPLWALFIAVQLLDLVWAPFVLLGIEKARIVPGITATNPVDSYYMPYSHSLIAALLWSASAYLVYRFAGSGTRHTSALVAGAVFSHWVLDLVVHRLDLPLYGETAKLELGLWNLPALAFASEIILLFGGMWLYFRSGAARRLAIPAFGFGMIALQAFAFFGPPVESVTAAAASSLAAYLSFAALIWPFERKPSQRFRS